MAFRRPLPTSRVQKIKSKIILENICITIYNVRTLECTSRIKKIYLRCSKSIPNSACQASTARLEWRAGTCQSRVSDPYPFFVDPDPDPEDPDGGQYGSGSNPDPGLYCPKIEKKITAEKKIKFFFDQKLQFTYP